MIKFLIIISFIFCFQSDTTTVSWHENHTINWLDFKGAPDQNSSATAITVSGITFSYTIQKSNIHGVVGFKTKVSAHFYPERSWCKKKLINDHILKHEQFHFNITELNVRRFRKNISNLKTSASIAKQLDALHQQANADLEQMQQLYDAETNYSINKEGQQKWVDFVSSELKQLDKYKFK